MAPKISIIVPVYNEEESLKLLMNEVKEVMEKSQIKYEILFIDDGSTDKSPQVLEELARENSEVKYIEFKRNFGQTAAILAGIEYSCGEYIIPMDADLQNDPADIPKMLAEAEQTGTDIVSGWRKNRKDDFLRSFCSKVANKLLSRFLYCRLHDYGCTLKVYRASVIKNIRLYGEMHRFLPAVAKWDGATVTEMVVNHRERQFGSSKYNLSRIRSVFFDLITMKFFTSHLGKPIRVFGRFGMWSFFVGMIAIVVLVYEKIVNGQDMTDTPFLLVGLIAPLVSIQLLSFGLLCEVQVRTYYESQGKRTFRIKKMKNFDPMA